MAARPVVHRRRTAEGQRKSVHSSDDLSIPDLFESAIPAGFAYQADFISKSEEQSLVRLFETLPFKPFEFHGYLGNRRIVSYGHHYDYGMRSLQASAPLPEWLAPLKQTAAGFLGVAGDTLQQALVTEYAPGAGIGWHRDKPMFEHVVAISFLAPCILRFRRGSQGNWLRRKQVIAPRSVYSLSGEAREVWEHSIPPVGSLRYSVTFRNFRSPK